MLKVLPKPAPSPELEANPDAIIHIYRADDGATCRVRWNLKRNKKIGLHAEWRLSGVEKRTIVVRARLSLYKMPRNIRERIALWLEVHKSGSS